MLVRGSPILPSKPNSSFLRRQRQHVLTNVHARPGFADVAVGRPQNRVDDRAAEWLALEVAVKMAERCAIGTAAVRPLVGPTDDDILPLGRHLQQRSGILGDG